MSKLKSKHWLSTSSLTSLIGLVALAAAPSWAATSAPVSAKARYQSQTEKCRAIGDHTTRANCLSEASTAYAQTQPTPPQEDPALLASNALRRCEKLPAQERNECVARISGQGSAEGSVAGGGVLYTLVTRETQPVAQALPPAVVPDPLPPPAAGPTPGARPLPPPPIEPAPAPPQPPRPADVPKPGSGS